MDKHSRLCGREASLKQNTKVLVNYENRGQSSGRLRLLEVTKQSTGGERAAQKNSGVICTFELLLNARTAHGQSETAIAWDKNNKGAVSKTISRSHTEQGDVQVLTSHS